MQRRKRPTQRHRCKQADRSPACMPARVPRRNRLPTASESPNPHRLQRLTWRCRGHAEWFSTDRRRAATAGATPNLNRIRSLLTAATSRGSCNCSAAFMPASRRSRRSMEVALRRFYFGASDIPRGQVVHAATLRPKSVAHLQQARRLIQGPPPRTAIRRARRRPGALPPSAIPLCIRARMLRGTRVARCRPRMSSLYFAAIPPKQCAYTLANGPIMSWYGAAHRSNLRRVVKLKTVNGSERCDDPGSPRYPRMEGIRS